MTIYNELKEYLSNNESEKIIDTINNLSLKELKEFIGHLQMYLYTDYAFFSQIKRIILEKFELFSTINKHIFNFLFFINENDVPDDFKFIINNINKELKILDILLSGVIRNHANILENLVKENVELSSYHKMALARFFIARGKSPSYIFDLLDIKQDLSKIKKERLKVALLVSGQIRGIEAALASWIKFFDFSDIDTDIFISTWEKSARPQNLNMNRLGSDDLIPIIKSSGKEDKDILKKLEAYLPPYELDREYFLKIFNRYMNVNSISVDIESEEKYPFFSNPMKLYYKIHKTFEMSKEYGVYDLYIRIRPDIILEGKKIDLKELECNIRLNNIIYAHYAYVYEYYGFGVDDKIAIAKHDLMEIYSNTWRGFDGDKTSMIGHATLAQNLIKNYINVKPIPDLKIKFTNYNMINRDFLNGE